MVKMVGAYLYGRIYFHEDEQRYKVGVSLATLSLCLIPLNASLGDHNKADPDYRLNREEHILQCWRDQRYAGDQKIPCVYENRPGYSIFGLFNMIRSTFILHILDLLLDGDPLRRAIRPQIDYVTDSEYEYTGAGLFATFQPSIGIEKFKVGEGRLVLDGVRINSSEIGSLGADTILFLKDGIIDFLEIHTYDGGYPRRELNNYVLKQIPPFGTCREMAYPE